MALIITYDHSRDPMNPDDLADKIAATLKLGVSPQVEITPTNIIVTHPAISMANQATIQTIISEYILTVNYTGSPGTAQGNVGLIRQHAQMALINNQTFLAVPSPTQAQAIAQVAALTRQTDGLIRFLLGQFDTVADS